MSSKSCEKKKKEKTNASRPSQAGAAGPSSGESHSGPRRPLARDLVYGGKLHLGGPGDSDMDTLFTREKNVRPAITAEFSSC